MQSRSITPSLLPRQAQRRIARNKSVAGSHRRSRAETTQLRRFNGASPRPRENGPEACSFFSLFLHRLYHIHSYVRHGFAYQQAVHRPHFRRPCNMFPHPAVEMSGCWQPIRATLQTASIGRILSAEIKPGAADVSLLHTVLPLPRGWPQGPWQLYIPEYYMAPGLSSLSPAGKAAFSNAF